MCYCRYGVGRQILLKPGWLLILNIKQIWNIYSIWNQVSGNLKYLSPVFNFLLALFSYHHQLLRVIWLSILLYVHKISENDTNILPLTMEIKYI